MNQLNKKPTFLENVDMMVNDTIDRMRHAGKIPIEGIGSNVFWSELRRRETRHGHFYHYIRLARDPLLHFVTVELKQDVTVVIRPLRTEFHIRDFAAFRRIHALVVRFVEDARHGLHSATYSFLRGGVHPLRS